MLSITLYIFILALLIYWVETPTSFQLNLLILRPDPADALEQWLKKFQWGNRSDLHEKSQLPKYKFYTEVIEILLNLARKMGGNYQESILFLREGLQTDRQFEKKLREMVLGTWLQMGMMVVLTWAFIFGSLSMVDVKVSFFHLFYILLWQMFGLLCLPIILKRLRKKYFDDIGKLWQILYILQSLAKVPLSRSEIFNVAQVQGLKTIYQKTLLHIVDKLKETCQKALQLGGSYEEEVKYIMTELRFQEKWHFELFEKRLVVVKLGLLSIFFLPSYLAFIFILLNDLLSLM